MPAVVTALLGPARCGKTQQLLTLYRAQLAQADGQNSGRPIGIGTALWLSPTRRSADYVRQTLIGGPLKACLRPNIFTFAQFAETIVQSSPQAVRPLDQFLKHQILRRLVDEAQKSGQLNHFGAIAHTGGLIDLLASFIADLKRQEIWPEQFRATVNRLSPSAKHDELARLYENYQSLLLKHHLYDAEGRFWSARDLLSKATSPPFEKLRLVVVDGFADFTRTQHEILEILAGRVESLIVTLPYEKSAEGRADLFRKSSETLAQLQRRHGQLNIETLPRANFSANNSTLDNIPAALAHLEQQLFKDPRHVSPIGNADGIEILAASGQLGEIQLIARRIKRLLVEGDAAFETAGLGLATGGSRMGNTDNSAIEIPKAGPRNAVGMAPRSKRQASSLKSQDSNVTSQAPIPDPRSPIPAPPLRPDEIVVVFRSTAEVTPIIREVFTEYGIPFSVEDTLPLERAPAIAALMSFLRLEFEDWPFRQVLQLLSHNYFYPDWPQWQLTGAAVATEQTVRALQIPNGREALLQAVARLSAVELSQTASDARKRRVADASVALGVLTRLSQAMSQLPRSATVSQWAAAIRQLAIDLGLTAIVSQPCDQPAARQDAAAWQMFLDLLEASTQLEQWIDGAAQPLSRDELLERITLLSQLKNLPREHDDVGRVRVLSAASARAIEIPYLFLAGLSEKAFPPATGDEHVFSAAESRRFNEAGLQFTERRDRAAGEMLLFYEVITRATRRLYLSYSALDDKAQPLSPSPFLSEVERVCGPNVIARTELADLSPIPQDPLPCGWQDYRVKAVATALAGDKQLLVGLSHQPSSALVADSLLSALRMTGTRSDRENFTPFDGMLTTQAARDNLAERYGPQHCWSTSQLEQYAHCPQQFYLKRVLKLKELADISLEADHFVRGRRVHALLADLHRQINALGEPCSPCEHTEQFERLCATTLAAVLQKAGGSGPLDRAFDEIDRQLITRWIAQYLEQHRKYEEDFSSFKRRPVPRYFEVSFGPVSGDDDDAELVDPRSTKQPFELACNGVKIRLSGRIDRIDVGTVDGQLVFNILDYKTSPSAKFKLDDIERGTALQLPLYALAVQDLILSDEAALPWQVGYWHVKDGGFKKALDMHEPSDGIRADGALSRTAIWEELRARLLGKVASLVTGIRTAEFPMHCEDEHCTSRCGYRTVCRVSAVRSLEKTWQAPQPADIANANSEAEALATENTENSRTAGGKTKRIGRK